MPLLELRDVTRAFFADRARSKLMVALDNVSLVIEEGEFVSLLGPSGCGKTVTLNLLAGFLEPTTGQVLFRGEEVRGPSPERGVVFQDYSLFPWLSVGENVAYALKGSKVPKAERDQRVHNALQQVGLDDMEDRRPNLLSGGMKQRVAIARLLAMDSAAMLMDEPFSALDEQTRTALDDSLRNLWSQQGKTIVFVTHSIAEAIAISSRIVLYSSSPGRIVREWQLPNDMPRDLDYPEARALRDEIRAHMDPPRL